MQKSKAVVSESLISTIQDRETSINNSKMEIIVLWSQQGRDLQKLQDQQQCSQNDKT